MGKSSKRTSPRVYLFDKSREGLSEKEKKIFDKTFNLIKKYVVFFRLDPDVEIGFFYAKSDDWLFATDTDLGQYLKYTIEISQKGMIEKIEEIRKYIIHELVHVFLHQNYTRHAESLCNAAEKRLLEHAEEALVTKMVKMLFPNLEKDFKGK